VVNAHRINRGQMPELNNQSKEGLDFYWVEADEPDDAAHKIVEIVRGRIPTQLGFDPIREVQVLCPMNRGRLGARALNLDLQAALNGDQNKPSVVRFGCSFRSGDKVMQTINDYDKDIFNGDLGFVHAVDPEAQELVLNFDGNIGGVSFHPERGAEIAGGESAQFALPTRKGSTSCPDGFSPVPSKTRFRPCPHQALEALHILNLRPLPRGHGSLRPEFMRFGIKRQTCGRPRRVACSAR
jgi:hypothetical protein